MKLEYALALDANPELPLPCSDIPARGQVALLVDFYSELQVTPQKDKEVRVYAQLPSAVFNTLNETRTENYRTLVDAVQMKARDFVIDTRSLSAHHRCVVISADVSVVGLVDKKRNSAYLVVSSEDTVQRRLSAEPDRYYLYRFARPVSPLILHSEILCSKWWRWRQTNGYLESFNALERRLIK